MLARLEAFPCYTLYLVQGNVLLVGRCALAHTHTRTYTHVILYQPRTKAAAVAALCLALTHEVAAFELLHVAENSEQYCCHLAGMNMAYAIHDAINNALIGKWRPLF